MNCGPGYLFLRSVTDKVSGGRLGVLLEAGFVIAPLVAAHKTPPVRRLGPQPQPLKATRPAMLPPRERP